MDCRDLVRDLLHALAGGDIRAAYQGSVSEFDHLSRYHRNRDIDIWIAEDDLPHLDDIMSRLSAIKLIESISSSWLSHIVYLVPHKEDMVQIDFTVGRLMVGPFPLHNNPAVSSDRASFPTLAHTSAVADLVLRPLFRGRLPPPGRLEEAQDIWHHIPEPIRGTWLDFLRREYSADFSTSIERVLDQYQRPGRGLVRMTLRASIVRLLRNARLPAPQVIRILHQWLLKILGRHRPFGRPVRGIIVAVLGTDGSGKSTVTARIGDELGRMGYRTEKRYMGRGRGNLPGVDTLRNRLAALAGISNEPYQSSAGTPSARTTRNGPARIILWLASWYYVIEYFFRGLPVWWRARMLGHIVITDRYGYDLNIMGGGSKYAARLVEHVMPLPDINVFLYAPVDIILSRKQERTELEIKYQNAAYQAIIDRAIASCCSLRFDTSCEPVPEISTKVASSIILSSHDFYSV